MVKKETLKFKLINKNSGPNLTHSNLRIAEFLNEHLGEYGDPTSDILKAIDYIFQENRGGNVILGLEDDRIVGAVVLNETGMSGYIPENILVYIAVHEDMRGQGLGKQLMGHASTVTKGAIALHVEPDNPAKHLYEAMGYTNKYLEMRLDKK